MFSERMDFEEEAFERSLDGQEEERKVFAVEPSQFKNFIESYCKVNQEAIESLFRLGETRFSLDPSHLHESLRKFVEINEDLAKSYLRKQILIMYAMYTRREVLCSVGRSSAPNLPVPSGGDEVVFFPTSLGHSPQYRPSSQNGTRSLSYSPASSNSDRETPSPLAPSL